MAAAPKAAAASDPPTQNSRSHNKADNIMIKISFPATESVFVFIWLLVRVIVWVRNKRIDWKREAILLQLFLTALMLPKPAVQI